MVLNDVFEAQANEELEQPSLNTRLKSPQVIGICNEVHAHIFAFANAVGFQIFIVDKLKDVHYDKGATTGC